MKEYGFYGWEQANVPAVTDCYRGIITPKDLYGALSEIWCEQTCAPRMRGAWTKENRTLGQCSITAFLAQDIFGGKVYGIPRPGGNYHCYNVVGDCCFDLTSEQFGGEKLVYENNPEQFREVHFAKEEKRLRYEYLKSALAKRGEDKSMGLVKGIHHVSMKCAGQQEFERTVHFYCDVIGLRRVKSWENGVMLNTGDGFVEIVSDGTTRPEQGCIRHFAFAADDVDACADAVSAAGYEILIEPKDIVLDSMPARIAFCRGPLGEEIEFFCEREGRE